MISLCFLICYLVTGKVAWHSSLNHHDSDYINNIRKLKQKIRPKDLCTKKANCFLPFVTECFELDFECEPRYSVLKHMLRKALLDREQSPDNVFDWSFTQTGSPNPKAKMWEI